jgi:hypothetical protein
MDASQLDSGRAIAIVLSLVFFAGISFFWLKELLFYRRNGWDFEQDFKGPSMYWGEMELPENKMSNSTRVKTGYPFLFLVSAVCLLGTIFT